MCIVSNKYKLEQNWGHQLFKTITDLLKWNSVEKERKLIRYVNEIILKLNEKKKKKMLLFLWKVTCTIAQVLDLVSITGHVWMTSRVERGWQWVRPYQHEVYLQQRTFVDWFLQHSEYCIFINMVWVWVFFPIYIALQNQNMVLISLSYNCILLLMKELLFGIKHSSCICKEYSAVLPILFSLQEVTFTFWHWVVIQCFLVETNWQYYNWSPLVFQRMKCLNRGQYSWNCSRSIIFVCTWE